ncbi:Hemin transport system permease protein HmuU [Anoxybacillus sp. BCO1]|nr:Hemin transport system permease protein HmuU [Anoxybacillus sp. BCO1]
MFADTIARSWFDPIELPVGLLLSFLGGPFFLYILHKRGMCVLSAKHITYQHSEHFSIEDVHIDIQKGEIVSLIGPNGSGNRRSFVSFHMC